MPNRLCSVGKVPDENGTHWLSKGAGDGLMNPNLPRHPLTLEEEK